MARVIPLNANDPISTINVTPLVDVMLVLLIVMILSIPPATHKIPVDIGQSDNSQQEVVPHRLDIARDGALAWDGRPIVDAALPGLLASARKEAAKATLHMGTDPDTRYERFDGVLAMVKRSGIEQLGFVGNQPLPE